MYSFTSRIRYSEVDSQCQLTLMGLTNYFQDCSVFHSESCNVGVPYLKEHHIAWVLTSWQICLNRMPHLMEEVEIQTMPYDIKNFYGYRNFRMQTMEGECLAYANSVWVMVDTLTGRPVKAPEEMVEAYGLDQPLPMEKAGRKLRMPEHMEAKDPVKVVDAFIDSNHHMNNEKYVMVAQSFVPGDFQIHQLRVEYRKAAVLGDILYPAVCLEEGRVSVAILDQDGGPFANVVFE